MTTATRTKTKRATFDDAPAGDSTKLWQDQIIDQLADLDPADFTHVVFTRNGETATVIATYPGENEAQLAAAELAENGSDEEASVVAASTLHAHIDAQKPVGALFDSKQYDDPALFLGKVDEKDIDKIRLDFSGSVMLDRKDTDDVEFMRRLKLGQSLELRVAATCASKKHGYTTGKEGDLDAIVFTGGLKVDTVYRVPPEEL